MILYCNCQNLGMNLVTAHHAVDKPYKGEQCMSDHRRGNSACLTIGGELFMSDPRRGNSACLTIGGGQV